MSITAGLAAVKTGFDLIKNALELLKRDDTDRSDVSARLLELQGLLLDTRQALVDAQDENRTLRARLDVWEHPKAIEDDIQFVQDGGFWVRKSEVAQGINNPYYPICWGDNHKLIPLIPCCEGKTFQCGIHKIGYNTKEYLDMVKAWQRRPCVVGRFQP